MTTTTIHARPIPLQTGGTGTPPPPPPESVLAATLTMGAMTLEGAGATAPLDANGDPIEVASIEGYRSGSPGAHVPQIVSGGRISFTGGGQGAPGGTVLRCRGASGQLYDVAISVEPGVAHAAHFDEITAVRQFSQSNPSAHFRLSHRPEILNDCGRTSATAPRDKHQIAAETPGVSISATGHRLDIQAAGVVIEDAHLADCYIRVLGGASITLRQCLFERTVDGPGSLVEIYETGKLELMEHCEYQGQPVAGFLEFAVKARYDSVNGLGAVGTIRRCKFPFGNQDFIKVNGNDVPTPTLIEQNFLGYGNLTGTAHIDAINIKGAVNGVIVRDNLVDMRWPDGEGPGNNAVRVVRDIGSGVAMDGCTIEGNIFLRGASLANFPLQIENNGEPGWSDSVRVRHNFIDSKVVLDQATAHLTPENYLYPGADGLVEWTGNRDHATGAVIVEPTLVSAASSVTIDELPRDRMVFDSGAALGLAAAQVPVSGTGTPGDAIEVQAVSLDDAGATTTAWQTAGTVDAGGSWSAVLTVPPGASWFSAQARVAGSASGFVQTANRFAAGHVIALWGEDEDHVLHEETGDTATAPALSAPGCFQLIRTGAGGPEIIHLDSGAETGSPMVAMANTFQAIRPGEKFALVAHTSPGATGLRALAADADASRDWSTELALHQFASAGGTAPGIAAIAWTRTPSGLAGSYDDFVQPLLTGRTLAGAAVSVPSVISGYQADHLFTELYSAASTRWAVLGPAALAPETDMQNADTLAGGAAAIAMQDHAAARDAVVAMRGSGEVELLSAGGEIAPYALGTPDGAGGVTGAALPDRSSADGAQRRAVLLAHGIARAAGMTAWSTPVLDGATWEPSGAWVELTSSAGPITTTRLARGAAALTQDQPHWTEVTGFEVNGVPVTQASVQPGGALRIHAPAGSFATGDVLRFRAGGGSGLLKFPEDLTAGLWQNLPIVDLGLAGLEGAALSPDAGSALLTAPQIGSSTFAVAATGPYFQDPAAIGAGIGAATMEATLAFQPGGTARYDLMQITGGQFRLEVTPSTGSLRLNAKDGGLTVLFPSVDLTGILPAYGTETEIRVAADLAGGWVKIFVDGALVHDGTLAANSGAFADNRVFRIFEGAGIVADVRRIRLWTTAAADGSAPATAPYKTIEGDAATINADPWKLGTDSL